MSTKQIDYNEEPVHYCKRCLYLGNPATVAGIEYCPECGSTEFEDDPIEVWEAKFEQKYQQGKFLKLNEKWKTIVTSVNKSIMLT